MDIKEIKSQGPNLIDLNSVDSPKKKRGRPKKTKPVAESIIEDEPPKLTEKEKLKEELLRLSDYNDDIVTKPINDKLGALIDEMDLAELRARIRQGRKITSKKMDTQVAGQVIMIANQVAGNLLGCVEELNESTQKDELLKDTTKDYLALNVLDYIPTELKMMGLYGSHVGASYYKAQANAPKPKPKPKPAKPNTEADVEEIKDEAPVLYEQRLDPDKLNKLREKLQAIKTSMV